MQIRFQKLARAIHFTLIDEPGKTSAKTQLYSIQLHDNLYIYRYLQHAHCFWKSTSSALSPTSTLGYVNYIGQQT